MGTLLKGVVGMLVLGGDVGVVMVVMMQPLG